jgi:hypothetical protein
MENSDFLIRYKDGSRVRLGDHSREQLEQMIVNSQKMIKLGLAVKKMKPELTAWTDKYESRHNRPSIWERLKTRLAFR